MAKIFEISSSNPVRLIKPKVKDASKYFYKHFDDDLSENLIPNFQTKACYFQKFSKSDNPIIQILSDFAAIICKLYDEDGLEVKSFAVVELITNILDQTFKCYEAQLNFTDVPEGVYQLRLSYNNDDLVKITYYSEPIEIKEIHENTILLEYANTTNKFSMILSKGWMGRLRVEGAILDFKPSSDDVVYNDELNNTTTLYSQPFRQFKLWLGAAEGLPDWVVDKVNRAFSFDKLTLDGDFYSKIDGAKFESQRVDLYPFSGQSIEITPVENSFTDIINTDDLVPTNEDMIQYVKTFRLKSVSENKTITDIFKDGTKLVSIDIINRGIDFPLNIKTTSTGSQDDINYTSNVEGITSSFQFNQRFNSLKQIQLLGLVGQDCDIDLLYIDYNAKKSNVPDFLAALPLGSIIEWHSANPADYDINFNFATGLGRADTEVETFAICDGRNSTPDKGGVLSYGYKVTTFESLGAVVGSNTMSLIDANIPKHHLKMFANTINTVAGDSPDANNQVARAGTNGSADLRYEMRKSTSAATLGKTSSFGGDVDGNTTPISFLQAGIVSLYIKKIA